MTSLLCYLQCPLQSGKLISNSLHFDHSRTSLVTGSRTISVSFQGYSISSRTSTAKHFRLSQPKFVPLNDGFFASRSSSRSITRPWDKRYSRLLSSSSSPSPPTGVAGGVNAATPNTTPDSSTGKSIFFSSLCLITFSLGVWQTARYFEKVEMVKQREEDLLLEPLPGLEEWIACKNARDASNASGDTPKMKNYRRVCLKGKFLHQHELLIGPRGPPPGALAESGPNSGRGGGGGMSSSTQGYWVVTPMVIVDCDEDCKETSASFIEEKEESASSDNAAKVGWFGWMFGRKGKSSQNDNNSDENLTREVGIIEGLKSTQSKDKNIVWINRGWIPRHFVNNSSNSVPMQWEKPNGIVQLMAMESETESPGSFTPPSRVDNRKSMKEASNFQKLLWFDRNAMEEMTHCPENCHPPIFVEIKPDGSEQNTNIAAQLPAKSSKEFVGEFKVTPEVHAGYAFTWFGLAGAGIAMTRKLLRRVP